MSSVSSAFRELSASISSVKIDGSVDNMAAVDGSIVRFPAALAFSNCRTKIKKLWCQIITDCKTKVVLSTLFLVFKNTPYDNSKAHNC